MTSHHNYFEQKDWSDVLVFKTLLEEMLCLSFTVSCGLLAAESMSSPCAYIIDPFYTGLVALHESETFPDSPAMRQEQHQCCKSTKMDVFFLMRRLANQFTRSLLVLWWTTRKMWLILGLLYAQQRADPWKVKHEPNRITLLLQFSSLVLLINQRFSH